MFMFHLELVNNSLQVSTAINIFWDDVYFVFLNGQIEMNRTL